MIFGYKASLFPTAAAGWMPVTPDELLMMMLVRALRDLKKRTFFASYLEESDLLD